MISGEGLSDLYYRDLSQIFLHLSDFLKEKGLWQQSLSKINVTLIEEFLQQYKTSGTNYMTKRRTLSGLLSRLVRIGLLQSNPVKDSSKMKQAAHLNLPFRPEQLKAVLAYLKEKHQGLYLCCLLMYGCFLRPHQEILLLKRGSFSDDFSRISLGGSANKSRRIRTVHVPGYVKTQLETMGITYLSEGINIISQRAAAFNESYFTTAWNRIKEVLLKKKEIQQDHTLYSFRHTAAVNMYVKTRDPYKIQQAFGHSSLRVTLTYLRNLGMIVDTSAEDLPDLPF